MAASIKNFPGVSVTELGPLPASESVSVVGAAGGGGLPVTITDPIGPHTAATSVSVTFATDEPAHHVIVDSSALPTDAATEATLSTLNGKVVHVDTGAVVVSSSVLPSGAATSANQSTEIASLSSIDGKTPALGQALAAGSTPVVLPAAQITALTPPTTVTVTQATGTNLHAVIDNFPGTQPISGTVAVSNFPATQPISAVSLPLPTGAATSANQATEIASLASLDSKTVHVDTGAVVVSSSALPTGAATSALQTAISGQLPSSLGIKTAAGSLSIAPASDAVFTLSSASNPKAGRSIIVSTYKDYTAGSVTTAAYTQIVASTAATVNLVEVFDSSGEAIILAVGAAASEVDQFYIFPGGNGPVSLAIPSGSRVSIKAKTNTASIGYQLINFYS